jgi:hypothetical protein
MKDIPPSPYCFAEYGKGAIFHLGLKPPRFTSLNEARKGYPGPSTGFFLCGGASCAGPGADEAQLILQAAQAL